MQCVTHQSQRAFELFQFKWFGLDQKTFLKKFWFGEEFVQYLVVLDFYFFFFGTYIINELICCIIVYTYIKKPVCFLLFFLIINYCTSSGITVSDQSD